MLSSNSLLKELFPGKKLRELSRDQRLVLSREYYKRNKVRQNQVAKDWYEAHKEELKTERAEYRQQRRDDPVISANERKKDRLRSGIRDATGESRFGICPICLKQRKLVQDHDGESGLNRGWPCASCNIKMLGTREALEIAKRQVVYLDAFYNPPPKTYLPVGDPHLPFCKYPETCHGDCYEI